MPDYSCYITISNNLSVGLAYVNKGIGHGYWEKDPPTSIAAKTTSAQFQVKDHTGFYGSDGWVQYRVELPNVADSAKPVLSVNFNDPTGDNDNQFSLRMNTGGALFALSNTSFPARDHPLTVTGTIDFAMIVGTKSAVERVALQSPLLNLYNSKNQLWRTSDMELWNASNAVQYNDSSTPGVAGSFRPVSVDIKGGGSIIVSHYLDSALIGVPFYVTGQLGDKVVASSSAPFWFGGYGQHSLLVYIKPPSSNNTFPWGYAGDVVWYMTFVGSNQQITCGESRLEMYGLTPTLPTFFKNQIGVNFLRAFVLPGLLDTGGDYVSWAINACFSGFNFAYNTVNGSAAFAANWQGGNFDLAKWLKLKGTKAKCNCYDQAGLVQIALGLAPGGATTWVFMQPFGYITQTNLIGVGQCNNPFFDNSAYAPAPTVGNNDPKRSAFGNHAFVWVASKGDRIGEACGGPHLATEDLRTYIAGAIQQSGTGPNQTTLYTSTKTRPGTTADAETQVGVTNVNNGLPNMVPTAITTLPPGRADVLDQLISRASTGEASSAETVINVDIPELKHLITHRRGTEVVYQSQNIARDHSTLEFVLGSDEWQTEVGVSIHQSREGALDALRAHLAGYHLPVDESFSAPPDGFVHGSYCLTSEAADLPYSTMLWVQGNIFTRVSAPVTLKELDDQFVKPIDSHYQSRQSPDARLEQPRLERIAAPGQVRNGDEFVVRVTVAGAGASGAAVSSGDNDKVVLLRAEPETQEYYFRAEGGAGTETLVFAFAHITSGHVVSGSVDVEVVDE